MDTVRLQKYLADCGVASRRKAEEYILAGRVGVNGETVTELGFKIDPSSAAVTFDGARVSRERKVYVMLNKPAGYVSTASDDRGRPAVTDLVGDIPERLSPVGRLDYNTSGLLLMTNDGELLYRLTHPKHGIEKSYLVRVAGIPTEAALKRLREGVIIYDGAEDGRGGDGGEGYMTAPARVAVLKADGANASIKITIHEGRNRQVRKMCAAIGHDVLHLRRVSTGRLLLGNLPKGKWRHLTAEEVGYLKGL